MSEGGQAGEGGLDPRTMFSYQSGCNVPWNVAEYQPVRSYEDPQRAITERKVRAGEASYARAATRRGSFLEQHLKNVKDLPPPCTPPHTQPTTPPAAASTRRSTARRPLSTRSTRSSGRTATLTRSSATPSSSSRPA